MWHNGVQNNWEVMIMVDKKINYEVAKFLEKVEKRARALNNRYKKQTGLYSSSLSNIGFTRDEVDYYKKRSR